MVLLISTTKFLVAELVVDIIISLGGLVNHQIIISE